MIPLTNGTHVRRRRRRARAVQTVRSVWLERSRTSGFGFTISGQSPCVLSCVTPGSPADLARLQQGDLLVGVNGSSVAEAVHDDVVRLIGCSGAVLLLQIVEQSRLRCAGESSSDEDSPHVQLRSQDTRKTPTGILRNGHGHSVSNSGDLCHNPRTSRIKRQSRDNHQLLLHSQPLQHRHSQHRSFQPYHQTVLSGILHPTSKPVHHSSAHSRALVAYVGSVEIPDDGSCKLASIRSAVTRLRNENRVQNLVLLEILENGVRLMNSRSQCIADYPSQRIVFCGAYPDDSRFFGLVTRGELDCWSCHVFMVDSGLANHSLHTSRALTFGITCTLNPGSGLCTEFPASPDAILSRLVRFIPESVPPPRPPRRSPPGGQNIHRLVRPASDSPVTMTRPHSVPVGVMAADSRLSPRALSSVPEQHDVFKVPRVPPPHPHTQSTSSQNTPEISGESTLGGFFRKWPGGSMRKKKSKLIGVQLSASHESLSAAEDCSSPADGPGGGVSSAVSEKNLSQLNHNEDEQEPHADECTLGRVAKWATGLSNLLRDTVGLATFTEFLKSEFSEENIVFWSAVEQYKAISDDNSRHMKATEIFKVHLDTNGAEPVNVDAAAREAVAAVLKDDAPVTGNLFSEAQNQVFHLLRLDSYSRFLKSELYKRCVLCEMESRPLPCCVPTSSSSCSSKNQDATGRLKGSRSASSLRSEEEKRKKNNSSGGFLPWMRNKGSKRLPRAANSTAALGVDLAATAPVSSNGGENRLSVPMNTVLLDATGRGLCRVILPDSSTAVVNPAEGTIRQMLETVCNKRSLALAATEPLVLDEHGRAFSLDLSAPAMSVSGREIRLEHRVLFRVEFLPSRKCVGVRARPGKTLRDVLRPVCDRYNLRADSAQLSLEGSSAPLSLNVSVTSMEGCKLTLVSRDDAAESAPRFRLMKRGLSRKEAAREELRLKSLMTSGGDPRHGFDEDGILDLQKSPQPRRSVTPGPEVSRSRAREADLSVSQSADDSGLLDILCRMQSTRLDSQRGDRIRSDDLELPDFLKHREYDKENTPAPPAPLSPTAPSPVFGSTIPLDTPPPPSFRDELPTSTPRQKIDHRPRHLALFSPVSCSESSDADERSTPSPSTHILIPPDSPTSPDTPAAQFERITFV